MPEAIVALGESKRVVGRLRFETDGRRQHSQFEYAAEWLAAPDRFALSPGLPLREGSHYSAGRSDRRSALPGCFADAAPDSWGRALMTRALGGGLSEFDYLVLSDDRTRQGALRFLGEDAEPLSDLTPPIPRLVELERLRALAQRFERDPGGAEAEARDLAGVAGSLGGARPKANVEGDGHLWIAKFTSAQDTRPVERVEVAALKLAARCGLRAAEVKLELRDSDSPIALIRRFDRRGNTRIPYISARTALDWDSDEGGFYTDIADVIRQISSKPVDDLHELWRRIVFTILVSNSDDHLKNHGFIYAGGDRWRLSPAFDINPSPSRHRVLETGIIQGGSFDASLDIALEACGFFELTPAEARQQAFQMAETIANNWRHALRDEGASSDDLRTYADAFEHTESRKALRLNL
ncbi:MAG: type II toxin-antitoxin system HipA family toxin [Desulfomicrobium sp.]|uniref:type II toxin-antitoxin system HipA family toxin n=1 Tax=Hoeflea sp. TaxID=1940281 RepID=UPI0025BDCAAA|nr:type II toxin-antitoxin system HipA family toxin [Hoeflea sp.]MBU4527395.1 type II toxin-antitoxin system HipA family toxin [Alphaproteobacteria bacterium]MBV1711975.1 type II toxin-antitoxin system HipA family toxin [Desulfomicrobium sp.]MBU4546282.1 type II toxin-antitoxin system HipA family toxin [Alphaproteobacteria bacterium]MBU4552104.1 type II toxin-antitoxin system HipA family toxin [Alphaproteobacteria bacterium]MBV1782416.1 type II toxin-antitoxin system HipA family toxin [Hoeflea